VSLAAARRTRPSRWQRRMLLFCALALHTFRLPGFITTEMKQKPASGRCWHYFVFDVPQLDLAAAYLTFCTDTAVAGFHLPGDHRRQPVPLQMLTDYFFELVRCVVEDSHRRASKQDPVSCE
jgi:hypothetical protein